MSDINPEEEPYHVISDQESDDEKPGIKSIIIEKCKIFQNESDAVKILLSDHYMDFRLKFFDKSNIIVQEIQRQIRNLLNTYRIYLDKEKDDVTYKELQELNGLLKSYYKDAFFDNVFFVNYFKDIREMNKIKKKYITNYPKDEIETLNDIERKVKIVKDLKHYLNLKITDKIQINFDSKDHYYQNPYKELKFNYLVIDEDVFSKMNEEQLKENISDKNASYNLRRPLNTYIAYNYIPILCRGSCLKEAKEFNDSFEKWIINHITKEECERCVEIKNNLNKIKSQIISLYMKTCVFSHNRNEIMFHPLMLFTMSSFDHFYKKELRKAPNKKIEKIVRSNIIPQLFKKAHYEMQCIYEPQGMKSIYNTLLEYSKKSGLYIDCCFKNEFKTQRCQINFKPKNNDYDSHISRCPYYHSNLEKRRMYKIIENEICKKAIENGGWVINNEEKIECENGDYCNKFHTRNELFFDERNYRKLYPCNAPYFCEKSDLCPKKHGIDIKINEIYLPKKEKEELKEKLEKIKEKEKKIQEKLKLFKLVQCVSCLNYIDGIQNRNMISFLNCSHKICSECYDDFQPCPICGFIKDFENHSELDEGKDYIEIKLNYKLPKPKKNQVEEVNEESEGNMDNINFRKHESYDKDITPIFDEDKYSNRKKNRGKNSYYSNRSNFKQNYENNEYHDNYNNYRDFRNHGRGRGKDRGRGERRERGRGKGRGGGRGKEREKENEIDDRHGSRQDFDFGNNENIENSKEIDDGEGQMNDSHKGNNIENENIEYSKEIRRGKGQVRGKKKIKMNYGRVFEEKKYVKEENENEESDNINNFDDEEEDQEEENKTHNWEDECSMKKEKRKEMKKIRGRGTKTNYNQIEDNEQKSEDNNELSEQEEENNVKLSNNNDGNQGEISD